MRKSLFCLLLLLAGFSYHSMACTNFIFTKGATVDGSVMITYSADSHTLYGELYFRPAMDYPEGTMVDVGQLVGRISKLAEAESIEGAVVTLDVSQSSVLVPSREATYLALVVNELVQNAFKHGLRGRSDGNVSVRITTADGLISVEVGDDGPGLPQGFDPDRDGNLGLTIVQTLVKDELKGQFVLVNEKGAVAKVIFPAPQMHQHLEERKEDL